ncbi:MAG: hypothetical protein WD555_01350 [Fulvivirga sp.]
MIQFLEGIVQDLKEADEGEENSFTVGERKRIYGLELRTKTELYQMATEQHIPNRSKMSHDELLDAIKGKVDGQQDEGMKQRAPQELQNKSREELYEIAQKRSIRGRSEMKKEKLLKVLQKITTKEKELV